MPTHETEKEILARQIAFEVYDRRRNGDEIRDEDVLRSHPALEIPLREQLQRLARGLAPLSPSAADLVQTYDLPPTPHEADSTVDPRVPSGDAPGDEESALARLRKTVAEPEDSKFLATVHLAASNNEDTTDETKLQTPLYRPSVRPPMAVVQLYHDGLTSYTTYPIFNERFRIGRTDGDLVVAHDFWMSGKHAEIQRRLSGNAFQWFLVDLKSTNGTFVQAERAKLKHNDELFLGQERYRFLEEDESASLLHVTKGDAAQWRLYSSPARIGRTPDAPMQCFVTDPYLDPVHAELVRERDGSWAIQDHESRNGVWIRIRRETELFNQCSFQLGEQRFSICCHNERQLHGGPVRLSQRPLSR